MHREDEGRKDSRDAWRFATNDDRITSSVGRCRDTSLFLELELLGRRGLTRE